MTQGGVATMRPLAECSADVLPRLGRARSVFCFLDYDGTLAPIASTPGEARPLPGIADALRGLLEAPRTQVAIVSGRPIAEVRGFIDLPGLHYVGIHGIEIEWATGERLFARGTGGVWAAMPEIRQRVERALAERPGILVEDKGSALAVHYRLASHADGVTVRRTLGALVRAQRRRGLAVTLKRGHAVSEVLPADVNKGTAVLSLLARCRPRPLSVYVGDDFTDHDAFAALPPDSVTIQVGARNHSVRARYCVAGPADVKKFLGELAAARVSRGAAPGAPRRAS